MDNKGKLTVSGVLRFSFLIFFSGLFFFSMGVFIGKKWSDRQYVFESEGKISDRKVRGKISRKKKKVFFEKSKTGIAKRKKKEKRFKKVESGISKNSVENPVQTSYTSVGPSKILSVESLGTEGSDSDLLILPKNQFPVYGTKGVFSPSSHEASISTTDKKFSLKPDKKIKDRISSYTIQVAAYKTKEEAWEHTQNLVDKGFPAFLMEKDLGDKQWFRVNIGSFKTKKEALRYEKALKRQTWIKKSFIRRISRPVEGR